MTSTNEKAVEHLNSRTSGSNPSQEIPQPHDLVNKPLVEAIFELRWNLQELERGRSEDKGYAITLGRYYDAVRHTYPVLVDLPSSQVPEQMTAHTVRHQFRAEEDGWPLTQIGPGILTINDTDKYTWSDFQPRVAFVLDTIFASYPSDIHAFQPSKLELRYIDAIPYDPDKIDPTTFIGQFLHTEIRPDPFLFRDFRKPDVPQDLRLNLTYSLDEPHGEVMLMFASGEHKKRGPSIIFETVVRSKDDDVPTDKELIKAWVSSAHELTDRWFFTLCRGELLHTFEGNNAKTKS